MTRALLLVAERAGPAADGEQAPHLLPALLVLGQHHRDGAAVLREAGLDHFDKEPVFLLAVVALVGEVAEEPAEVGNVLPRHRAAAGQLLGHRLQRGQHFHDQFMFLHHQFNAFVHGANLV